MNNVLNEASISHKSWNNLSMQEKAAMIRVAVKNGLTDLNTIREKYNEFAGGGYLDWKEKASKYKHLDIDNDRTYDYEGWYNENPQRAWDFLNDSPDAHFDDKYKTVYHPTFSTQSKYSGVVDPVFNPDGLVGGTWNKQGTVFTMSPDGYRGPVSMDERAWYLMNAEDNGVQLREADGSLPVFDGIPWGGVLPTVTVSGNRFAGGGDIYPSEEMNEFGGGGYIYDVLPGMLKKAGLDIRVSSGYRPAGKVGTSGKRSWHWRHGAVDIVPQGRTTFEDIERVVSTNPEIIQYMTANGFGYLDETNRTPEGRALMKRTGATGNHFHFGKDTRARERYQAILGRGNAATLPVTATSEVIAPTAEQPIVPFFMPSNPQVFFGNPVTTSQPVVDMEPIKTPVLEYDPKEAERQEKRDNLNRFNMFLGMLNGSNESTFPFSMFAEGGGIHIKPENRGKFTALKERTGHSATWFKEHGTPAQKKMATFALNSRHWKHGLGGNLFEDGGPKKPLTRDDLRRMLLNRRAEAETAYNGSVTETRITPNDNAWVDKPLTRRKKNPHSSRRAEEGAKAHAAWEREHPNLAAWGNLAGAIPFAVAAAPLGAGIVAGGDALAATTAGQAITSGLAPLYQAATGATIAGAPALTWADVGLISASGAHGISQAVEDGGISPMTAIEITPLGRVIKPLTQEAASVAKTMYNNGTLWDAYTTFGGRFGNYGENLFTNMYGTAARRFGLPDKARIPADGIRKINEFPRISNGMVDFTGNRNWYGNPHVNATIDRGVVSHSAGGWDGADTYLFPFRDFLAETKGHLKSIEPSDVFSNGVAFMESPSKVTLISGDVTALENAQKIGMQTLSSPRLRRLYSEAETKYNANKLLTKHPKKEQYWKEYADEVQRLQSQRGVPTLEDFRLLEQTTGLKAGIAPLSEYKNAIKGITEMQKTMYKPGGIRAIMNDEVVPYTYPNGRKVDWTIQGVANELNALQRAKYNNVFYDPTTYIESIWREGKSPKW